MASKRSVIFQSLGIDFNKNLQATIQETFHSIEVYKPGYMSAKEYVDWRNHNLQRNPLTKDVFVEVEKRLPREESYQTDALVLEFSRYGKTVYEDFVRASADDESLMRKAENLNRLIIEIDESQETRRNDANITLEVSKFAPEPEFHKKFVGVTDNLRVKFMFENHIKDTEKLAKDGRLVSKVVL